MTEASDNSHPFQLLHEAKISLFPVLHAPTTLESPLSDIVTSIRDKVWQAVTVNSNAALASLIIDNHLPFTVRNSIHVSVVAALYAKHEEWPEEDIFSLICAAITMNIIVAKLQDELCENTQELNLLQTSAFESHPKLGKQKLSEQGIKNRDWLNAVMQHHEREDGSGPLGMRGNSITKHALALSLADRYCTLIAVRCSRNPIISQEYLRLNIRTKNEEEHVMQQILPITGALLPATMVKLVSGEVAVVSSRTDNPEHPLVCILGSQGKLSFDNMEEKNTAEKNFKIDEVLDLKTSFNKVKLCQVWHQPILEFQTG
ncbi:hypothetical protein MNBD_GAMMA16-2106 [hydrothermal vent metagenome]|uniref:HD-GYP domain-containing protein n=1 Tax=hydrothermal vent metagenome TaxID=652676 RepID=A0A3B0YW06_9ZZZZ